MYDDWVMNGNWHTCVRGHRWSDSDGGPCCEECVGCGDAYDADELDDDGRCENCAYVKCKGCSDKLEQDEVNEQGLCECCQEQVDQVKSASIEELPLFIDELYCSVAEELLKERLSKQEDTTYEQGTV